MATAKANATRKTTEKNVEETKPAKKKVWKAYDPIPCRSIVAGSLGMIGIKSKINYNWSGQGDITEVEYQDLVAAIRSSKLQVMEPDFIILDEEFLKDFPKISAIYDKLYDKDDLSAVIRDLDPQSMKLTINNLPDGAKESIKNIAATMITSGEIDSVQKIKALDEVFETKFMLMTELFN